MHSDERPDALTWRRALVEHVSENAEGFLTQLQTARSDLELSRALLAACKPESNIDRPEGEADIRVDLAEMDRFTTDELESGLGQNQSPRWMAAALRRMYFQDGDLHRPLALIKKYPALLPQLSHRDRVLAQRIESATELWNAPGQLIPPKCVGAAIKCERHRVMYCVHSTPVFHSNGYSTRTHGVAVGVTAAGTDIHVVARLGYPWDTTNPTRSLPSEQRHTIEMDGVQWTHIPGAAIGAVGLREYVLAAADAFVREAKNIRPSVMHAASNYVTGLAALIAARRLGLPFVYEVRGLWEITEASVNQGWERTDRYALQKDMETFVATRADRVLAITTETRAELIERGVPASRVELLPNGVDSETFLPLPFDEEMATRLGLADKPPIIGFAGSFVQYEGLELLLQSAEMLVSRGVRFHLALAGNGGTKESLADQVSNRGLGQYVTFAGRLEIGDVPRFLGCVDLICCPRLSLPVTEMVSPLKPLEAFSAGKPVVMSDVSPHRILAGVAHGGRNVRVGSRGILHEPGSVESLADALQLLLEDRELSLAMGRRSRRWVMMHRQWKHLGALVLKTYSAAQEFHRETGEVGKELSALTVAVIADEFTTRSLEPAVDLLPLKRTGAPDQIRAKRPDLLLIESAWSGNNKQWHRGVGNYSAADDEDLAAVIRTCNDLGIPTVFWNKEDPVHYRRFLSAALRCDHVFTSDADLIATYVQADREAEPTRVRTVSSLPFFAQPAIHNPLSGCAAEDPTFAYAGTFYGARYPERSRQLGRLLETAGRYGLTIYDRQLGILNSPYRFPDKFRDHVRGSIPYQEVLTSYSGHIAQLNANSVSQSPTMFSRRVVEVAASGGVILSTGSRAVSEVFNGCIPATNDAACWDAIMALWHRDPEARRAEAWLQMRTVLRGHTADSALIILARTAGLAIAGLTQPSWGASVDFCDEAAVDRVLNQSWLPTVVVAEGQSTERPSHTSERSAQRFTAEGIKVVVPTSGSRTALPHGACDWWACLPKNPPRTWAEDALSCTAWGHWDTIFTAEQSGRQGIGSVVDPGRSNDRSKHISGSLRRGVLAGSEEQLGESEERTAGSGITLVLPGPRRKEIASSRHSGREAVLPNRLLIAGHDLKFLRSWQTHLRSSGVEVLVDLWDSHAEHDEATSVGLMVQANAVFCEWGLGNAVWYSQHVQAGKRLVVRIHGQELRGPHLRRINHDAVDIYVFVSRLALETAVRSHGVPREKSVVIPNAVQTETLDRPKTDAAEHTMGVVGLVPQSKRPDRALDIIELLLEEYPDFTLRLKGRQADEYPWMHNRPGEMAFYDDLRTRAASINKAAGREAVVFDPHGDDMASWFQGIGFALSVSDHESFHLTLPDGASSGAVPLSLAWAGSEFIYPREWLHSDVSEMAESIAMMRADAGERDRRAIRAQEFVRARMTASSVHEQLDDLFRKEWQSAKSAARRPLCAENAVAMKPDFRDEWDAMRNSLAFSREMARTAIDRLARVSHLYESQKLEHDDMQKKIWWLESEWSSAQTRRVESKTQQDSMQKKIWWLESELRKRVEQAETPRKNRIRLNLKTLKSFGRRLRNSLRRF
ncbi:glycosyltransferase [Kocuria marina]|uniref:D-inositol 3-phosphate glycosyltransferase n=1 Tax=Kocuria marina subsp. indica TaxID=1049583 RepID=A0A1X7DMX4_9MICC|nr:glycosyltransferase [Kocuria indica]OXS81928.1 hypothetical protein B1B07_09255 [Kocuria indica]RLP59328.1 glycosyltransferase [Kocuria indica]SMF18406.1 Glycosyltransferase involved in cell wall bisynthesis [Kocuria indica]